MRITIIRFVIALFLLTNQYRVRYTEVRQYLLRTPEMFKELNNDICQRKELLDIIQSKKEELEGISLKVLGIEYVEKPLRYKTV